MVQLKKNNTFSTIKETIFYTIKEDYDEISTFHKVIRIVYIVALTLIGIIATVMFNWNIINYQHSQKQFYPKIHSPESINQSSPITHTDEQTDENDKQKKKSTSTSIKSVLELNDTGLEPKSSDFPTIITSKSRSSAGQDDDNYNSEMTLAQKHIGWDEIEMMRHGLINCDCERVIQPKNPDLPVKINIGNTSSSKMTISKQTDHNSATIESTRNIYSDYYEDFHKSI
ncbi:unnamed protein product [Brugia pahangi]|uniref:Uncharacterized protein n=1 Tax=Brugia pahangi TaxID=6280 RepID=A0A0N4TWM4_BRUPA|nr:unnamed protein product [Brugia pahangi]